MQLRESMIRVRSPKRAARLCSILAVQMNITWKSANAKETEHAALRNTLHEMLQAVPNVSRIHR
jgi:hypothetical protein